MNPPPLDYGPLIPTVQDQARRALASEIARSLQVAGWSRAGISRDEEGYQLRASREGTHWVIEADSFEALAITAAAILPELAWVVQPDGDSQ